MEEIVTHSSTVTQKYHEDADWHRASTLTERIASLQNSGVAPHPLSEADQERGRERVKRWQKQPSLNDPALFEQRLQMDSIDEQTFLALLSEPVANIQAREATPAWLEELFNAYEHHAGKDAPLPFPVPETPDNARNLAYIKTLQPLLSQGIERLWERLMLIRTRYTKAPFEIDEVIPLLCNYLSALLVPKLLRTLVLELNVARVQGGLEGEEPVERFQKFLQSLHQPENMLPLLEEYAVLARLMVETIQRWVDVEVELLERLCIDWEELCTLFPEARDAGKLRLIRSGLGDVHRGGRSVSVLVWTSGFRLVYKPRSLAVDQHFQEVLIWMNEQGYKPAFRPIAVLDKGNYGWVEFVRTDSCTSEAEIERFYQRQGGYLALLYALDATDFHSENLIAAGEHPVLIDMEALFGQRVTLDAEILSHPGLEAMMHSVLRVGLLPQRIWSNDEGEGIDISGFGGQAGQMTPHPVAKWAEVGTDHMKLDRERVVMPIDNHRPTLQRQDIDTLQYRDSISAGFTAAYTLLLKNRDTFLAEVLPRFTDDECRCLLRQTETYAILLNDSCHPNVLRDALDREQFFDRLWAGIDLQPYLAQLIPFERADLLNGDIPLFNTRPGARDLITSRGIHLVDFFDATAMDLVKQHVNQFSERDLEQQRWMIEASFTSMTMGSDQVSPRPLVLRPSPKEASYERIMTAARAVGDRLEELALHYNDMVGWLGVTVVREREWHLLPADIDLYGGTSGITLFLAYLGKLSGEQRYSELARLALQTTRQQIELQRKDPNMPWSVGAFNGLGSYIYLLSHLGSLWNDATLYREAQEIAGLLPDLIAQDKMFDVMAGTAGCLMSLLSLYAVAPTPELLALALQCGDRLVATASVQDQGIGWCPIPNVPPLAGLAHGNAGIALALLRLAAISGEKRFVTTAQGALEYERLLYVPERGNWLDLRPDTIEDALRNNGGQQHKDAHFMVGWCNGAPGIALARIGSLQVWPNAQMRTELEAALHTTIAHGFGMNHSLCHGDMGHLDILLSAVQFGADTAYKEAVQHLAPMLLESIETQGWITGVPQGVETPGLMVGITGIGYALLRLASPTQVPSVLLLSEPIK